MENDRMIQENVIKPETTEWASQIVFGPKKDRSLRFCVSYRKLNALAIQDSCLLTRMDEYIDSMGDSRIFLTVDGNSEYCQVKIDKRDREKPPLQVAMACISMLECHLV